MIEKRLPVHWKWFKIELKSDPDVIGESPTAETCPYCNVTANLLLLKVTEYLVIDGIEIRYGRFCPNCQSMFAGTYVEKVFDSSYNGSNGDLTNKIEITKENSQLQIKDLGL